MPGEWQKYSNFGYLLLSRIIEEVAGKPYADFIKEDVLLPAGVYDMHIAGIYYEDKRENEVRYYTHEVTASILRNTTAAAERWKGAMVETIFLCFPEPVHGAVHLRNLQDS